MDDAPAPPLLWRGDGTDQAGIVRPPRPRTLAGRHVRVRGLDAAGLAAAEAAARAGAVALSLIESAPGATRRAARMLTGLAPGLRVHLDTERRVDGEIVTAYAAVAPALHHRLLLDGPHVALLTDEAGVTVLPVAPGATACLRCLELARTDRDPAWPVLARQCAALPAATDPLSASVAGALAAALLAALLDGARATPCRVERGLPRRPRIVPHPACGCGAA
ncbi:hypothetical protein [Demequina soli]|uniref:hypothetical protein n=1 Tax=Demequina soli TaxID=1638987 RepID=UPI000782ED83|nr:hypothetical protein [Demequina soli]